MKPRIETKKNKNSKTPIVKMVFTSVPIVVSILFITILYLLNMDSNWVQYHPYLLNIMPILMGLVSIFAIGYYIIYRIISGFFKPTVCKEASYRH